MSATVTQEATNVHVEAVAIEGVHYISVQSAVDVIRARIAPAGTASRIADDIELLLHRLCAAALRKETLEQ